MRFRLIAGLFSILLVLLVVVGPVYLSEKLEAIETSNGDIYTYEEIASSITEQYITPWWQFKNETSVPDDDETIVTESGAYFDSSTWDHAYKNPLTSSWDVVGYWDYFTVPADAITEPWPPLLMLKGGMSATVMYLNGISNISIGVEYSGNYNIPYVEFCHGFDYYTNQMEEAGQPSSWGTNTYSGLNWFNFTVPSENLITSSYEDGSYAENTIRVAIRFTDGIETGDLVKTNFKICPNYLIENVTTGNTTYRPYLQTFTPYSVHRVLMGIGGILIIIAGLVASPLPIGEAFDGIFPVSHFTPKRTKSRKKR